MKKTKIAKTLILTTILMLSITLAQSFTNFTEAICWKGGTLGGTENIIWCNGAASNCSYQIPCD